MTLQIGHFIINGGLFNADIIFILYLVINMSMVIFYSKDIEFSLLLLLVTDPVRSFVRMA